MRWELHQGTAERRSPVIHKSVVCETSAPSAGAQEQSGEPVESSDVTVFPFYPLFILKSKKNYFEESPSSLLAVSLPAAVGLCLAHTVAALLCLRHWLATCY